MEERIQAILKERFGRDLDNCTKSEIFEALMVITKQEMAGRKRNTGNKKLYYISAVADPVHERQPAIFLRFFPGAHAPAFLRQPV